MYPKVEEARMSVRCNGLWAAAVAGLGFALCASPVGAQAPQEEGDPWGQYEQEPGSGGGEGGGGGATATGTVPEGLWVAGGIHGNARRGVGGGGLRGEVGLPLMEMSEEMRLAIAIPLYTAHRRWYNQLYIVPEIQFEIDLPIDMKHKLSVVPYAGLGLSMHFFSGGFSGSSTGVALTVPLGAWARFTMDNGFMAQVMPLGMSMNIGMNDNWGRRFFASYHFFAMAGYRWD
jgi:hypothetical protein